MNPRTNMPRESLQALSDLDKMLITVAEKHVRELFAVDQHFVAAAARTADQKVFSAINLAGSPRGIDVCGEPGVLTQAIGKKEKVETIVAVRYEGPDSNIAYVASPCGKCRELILRYAPDAHVIVRDYSDTLIKISIKDLLPYRYQKASAPSDEA